MQIIEVHIRIYDLQKLMQHCNRALNYPLGYGTTLWGEGGGGVGLQKAYSLRHRVKKVLGFFSSRPKGGGGGGGP